MEFVQRGFGQDADFFAPHDALGDARQKVLHVRHHGRHVVQRHAAQISTNPAFGDFRQRKTQQFALFVFAHAAVAGADVEREAGGIMGKQGIGFVNQLLHGVGLLVGCRLLWLNGKSSLHIIKSKGYDFHQYQT